jgi:hypothetical protein
MHRDRPRGVEPEPAPERDHQPLALACRGRARFESDDAGCLLRAAQPRLRRRALMRTNSLDAELQPVRREPRKRRQPPALGGADPCRARRVRDDADRAKRVAVGAAHRHSRVEADMRRADHQRLGREAWIARRVRHDEARVVRALDGVDAERPAARLLLHRHADPRLEPLPCLVDEGYQGDRGREEVARQHRKTAAGLLLGRIEDAVAVQRGKALSLARAGRRDGRA